LVPSSKAIFYNENGQVLYDHSFSDKGKEKTTYADDEYELLEIGCRVFEINKIYNFA